MFKLIIITMVLTASSLYGWSNWAGNQHCNPERIFYPQNLEELQLFIRNAATEHKQIRVVGTGHSWSDIVCTPDHIINMQKFNKIVSVDQQKKQVKVQAGITLKELYRSLADRNLALPNQAAIRAQTLAGTVSTATHGSGHTGTMASFVIGVDLITADGSLLEITEQKNKQLFPAVRTSIGSLGVIYALTLQCESTFMLRYTSYKTDWPTIQKEYQKLLADNDYFQFFINPYTNEVVVDIHNRIGHTAEKSDLLARLKDPFVSGYKWLVVQASRLYEDLHRRASWEWISIPGLVEKEGYSHNLLSGDPAPLYLEEEIAVEKKDFPQAIQATLDLIKKYAKQNIYVSRILIRFAASDQDNYLSHAAGRDTAFISIMTSVSEKYYPFYKDFYKTLLPFNGRPHWGKLNYVTPADAQKLYGQNYSKFKEIRAKLDPNGMFSNNFTARVFGN